MDFFSGSGTTAEAVMRINYKNNSTIKYIMVQLEEDLEENFRKSFGKEKKILENAYIRGYFGFKVDEFISKIKNIKLIL